MGQGKEAILMIKFFIIFTIFFSTFIYPHGGRTNAEGCHNQRGGSYHCHGKKKSKRKKTSTKKHTIKSSSGKYDCSRKYCKYMTSCEEAYYKLKTCDHSRLDRDNDGVPCENICSGG